MKQNHAAEEGQGEKPYKLEESGAEEPPLAAAGKGPGDAWISYAVPSPSRRTPFNCAS